MVEPRLKAGIRVSALLRRAQQGGGGAMVLRRGDGDAGTILVVLRDRDGRTTVLAPARTIGGDEAWVRGTGAAPVDQAAADAYVAREVARDPDLWVLEVDAPGLVPPFEAVVLESPPPGS